MVMCVRCAGRGRLTANAVPCISCDGRGEVGPFPARAELLQSHLEENTVEADNAIAIAEEALRFGFEAGAAFIKSRMELKLLTNQQQLSEAANNAWSEYEPSEAAKALTR